MALPHPAAAAIPTLDVGAAWGLFGEPVDAVEPLGQGTRSRVYRVTFADGATRVVRLTPKNTGRIAREGGVRARMAGSSVHLPPAVVVTRSPLVTAADVVLMDELPGRTMAATLAGCTEASAERLWYAFGEQLSSFHAVSVQGFGLLDGTGRGAFTTWRAAMEHQAESALTDARATSLIDLCDRAALRLEALAPSLDRVNAARLCHGDAQPGNVQVVGDHITAWFDLEYASAGDPLFELAFVGRFFERSPWSHPSPAVRGRFMEAFTRGYTARLAPVLADGERLAYYRIVHALRSAEFLRVAMGSLEESARAAAESMARARLEETLTRS